MSRLWCRLTSHKWHFLQHHGVAARICVRCGEVGWHR